jgi:hypothetical protein
LQILASAGYVSLMGLRFLTNLLFILALTVAAPASAAVDDGTCRNGGFPSENGDFGLAVIKGVGRTYLLYDMQGCPNASAQCKKAGEGYVLPGDRVLTGRSSRNYVCAYFSSRGGGSAGWVEKARLRPLTVDRRPPLSSWLGRWSDEGNPYVRISLAAKTLHIAGQSLWPGPEPNKDWPAGWPHVGGIDGKLIAMGSRARYAQDDCKIDFVLVGDILVASDRSEEGTCGGANVRFDGVYRRVTN